MAQTQHPKRRLIEDEAIKAPLAAALSAQKKYQSIHDELRDALNPAQKLSDLKAAMRQLTNPEDLKNGAAEVAKWTGDGAALQKEAAQRAVSLARSEFTATIPPLLDAAGEVVAKLQAETVDAEAEFFASFGMKRETTAVAARVTAIAKEIEFFRVSHAGGQTAFSPPLRNALSHIIRYFDPSQSN